MALRREITDQIMDLLRKNPQGLSITEIVRKSSINRNTAGRYLDNLLISGQVEMRHFGMAKIYSLSQRLPVSSVLSISSELVMQLDASLRIVFLNQPFAALLGTGEKEILGKNIDFSPLHPFFDESFPVIRTWLQNGLAGTEFRGELEIPSQNLVFFCRIAPTVFTSGQKGVSVLFEDITRKKRAEARIRESEARLRSIIRAAPIGIGLVVDRVFLEVNEQFCRICGYTAGELVGYSARILYPTQDEFESVGREYLRQIGETGTASVEARWLRKDGVVIEALLNATPLNPADPGAGITFTALDVTERNRALRALADSEARLNLALSGSDTGMWELEVPAMTGTVDSRAAAIIGLRQGDIGSMVVDWDALTHPDDIPRVHTQLRDCLEGKTPVFESEHRMRHAAGGWIWVSGKGKITDWLPDGTPHRISGTIQDISRRKKAEIALRESEERFRTLVNNAGDMITLNTLTDDKLHGHYIEVNDVACRRLQYTRPELLAMAPEDLVAPDSLDPAILNSQVLLAEGHATFETVLLTKDRQRIPVEISAHLFDFRGRPMALAIIRDITDRKQAEEQLRLLKISVDNAYDEVFWMDFSARFLYVNDAVCRTTGYTREEIYAMKVYDLDPDFTPARWAESIDDLRRNKKQFFQTRHRRKDGVIIDVEISSVYVPRGGEEYSFCFVRDITERKRIEAALRESEGRYRSLAEVSQDLIYVIDREDKVVYINQQAADLIETPAASVAGMPRSALFPAEVSTRQFNALQQVFATGQPIRSESPMPVGTELRWFDHALMPIPGADGRVMSVLGVSRDITRRITAEQLQRQNEETNRFIAEHSVDIINRQTPECILTYTSPSVTKLLGYEEEEVLGKSMLALVHPEDLPRVVSDIAAVRDSGQDTVTSTFRFRHRDGRYLRFESTTRIVRDASGNVLEFLSISRDITERHPAP
jgi:PAS domain S-box-containing protein